MKAVFFDFDGTLTTNNKNVWKSIWSTLGYDTGLGSEYKRQLNDFLENRITYQEWCNQTLACYLKKNLNKEIVNNISKNIKLINGAIETFKILKAKGYSLHILSGNIITVIQNVLNENIKYFDTINANEFIFDENNNLIAINGTKYDCEGKAEFIKQYMINTNSNPNELYFVGNGYNDEWAHLSGCNTICVNPEETEHTNETKWHYVIENLTDLQQILDFIK